MNVRSLGFFALVAAGCHQPAMVGRFRGVGHESVSVTTMATPEPAADDGVSRRTGLRDEATVEPDGRETVSLHLGDCVLRARLAADGRSATVESGQRCQRMVVHAVTVPVTGSLRLDASGHTLDLQLDGTNEQPGAMQSWSYAFHGVRN